MAFELDRTPIRMVYDSHDLSLYAIGITTGFGILLYAKSMKVTMLRPTEGIYFLNMIQTIAMMIQLSATGLLIMSTPAGCLFDNGLLSLTIQIRSLSSLIIQSLTIHKIRSSFIVKLFLSASVLAQIGVSIGAMTISDGSDCSYFASSYSLIWTLSRFIIQIVLVACICILIQIGQYYNTSAGQSKRSIARRIGTFIKTLDDSNGTASVGMLLMSFVMLCAAQRTSVNPLPFRVLFSLVGYLETYLMHWATCRYVQHGVENAEFTTKRGLPIEQLRINSTAMDANDILTPRPSITTPQTIVPNV
ncbi:hypothetical protein RTP6_003693 [Batrachochytrium dendrobatidis]